MKKTIRVYSCWLKTGMSALLILAFGFVLTREIQSGRIKDRLFVRHLIRQRGRVQSKAKAVTLNHFMPRDFSFLSRAVRLQPSEIDPERFAEYVTYYSKVVEYLPQMADGHNLLGVSLLLRGHPAPAEKSFKAAQALAPGMLSASYNLAVLYSRAGDPVSAVKMLRLALRSRPQDNMRYTSSSRLLLVFLQDAPDPGEKVGRIVKQNYQDAYRLMVASLLKSGQPAAALQTASEALEMAVGARETFLYFSGLTAYLMADYDRAVVFLRSSLETGKQWPEAYYYLGLAMRERGLEEAAGNMFQRAGRLHDANGPTKELTLPPGLHLF